MQGSLSRLLSRSSWVIFLVPALVLLPVCLSNGGLYVDEAAYLTTALALSGKTNFAFYTDRYPLLPYLLAVLFRLNPGLDPLFLGNVIAYLFALGTVYASYSLAKALLGSETGKISILLMSISWYFWGVSAQVLTDVPSLFLVLLSLVLYLVAESSPQKGYAMLCTVGSGVLGGLAILMRFQSVLAIFVVVAHSFYTILRRRSVRRTLMTSVLWLGVVLVTFISILRETYFTLSSAFYNTSMGGVTPTIPNTVAWLGYTAYDFSFLPVLLAAATLSRLRGKQGAFAWSYLAISLVPIWIGSHIEARFILPAFPLVVILASRKVAEISRFRTKLLVLLFLGIMLFTQIAPLGTHTGWENLAKINSPPDSEFLELANWVRQYTKPTDTIYVSVYAGWPGLSYYFERHTAHIPELLPKDAWVVTSAGPPLDRAQLVQSNAKYALWHTNP